MRFEPWVLRHPVTSFLMLAYGISWGGILIVMGATDFNLLALRPLDTGLVFVLMLLGPSTSGLALTALLEGKQGIHRLGSRLTHWRVGLPSADDVGLCEHAESSPGRADACQLHGLVVPAVSGHAV